MSSALGLVGYLAWSKQASSATLPLSNRAGRQTSPRDPLLCREGGRPGADLHVEQVASSASADRLSFDSHGVTESPTGAESLGRPESHAHGPACAGEVPPPARPWLGSVGPPRAAWALGGPPRGRVATGISPRPARARRGRSHDQQRLITRGGGAAGNPTRWWMGRSLGGRLERSNPRVTGERGGGEQDRWGVSKPFVRLPRLFE